MPPQGLTDDQLIDWYCMFVPSTMSVVACLYMFATYAMFERIRTPAVNLVMLQTFSELCLCLSHNAAFYDPPATGTDLCRFQGWLINFAIISSVLFTTAMSKYMNATLSRARKQIELNGKNLAKLAVCVYSFAALCASLPFIHDQYANLGPKCWIAEDEDGRDRNAGVAYRFGTHYAIIWAANIYLFICYYEVIKYLRENSDEREKRGDNKVIRRTIRFLVYYPVICFCVWLPFTALRLTTAIRADPYLPGWALGAAHVILSFEGVLYAIAFSQYRAVRQEWTRFIFGADALNSSTPLTLGKASSDGSPKDAIKKDALSALTPTENIMSSGFDVSTIDDMNTDAFVEFTEMPSDLELRETNKQTRFSTNI